MNTFLNIIDSDKRLDVILSSNMLISRTIAKKLIEDGNVKLNNEVINKSSTIIKKGTIEVHIPEPEILNLEGINIPLIITYQDKDIVVINKEAGIAVHPSLTSKEPTIVNSLIYHIKDLSDIGGVIRPGIVHRLDKNTSGLMVITKNNISHRNLSNSFKNREVKKKYLAIVRGIMAHKEGKITTLIGRDSKNRKKMSAKVSDGKEAISRYKVLEESNKHTLLEVEILTGRTHQIRVHMSYLNHPIIGDDLYDGRSDYTSRSMLHSHYLSFEHPITKNNLEFKINPSEDFLECCEKLNLRYFRNLNEVI